MRSVYSVTIFLLLALMFIFTEAGKLKKERGKGSTPTSECTEWSPGICQPKNGRCGPGVQEDTCNDMVKKHKCKVPCNGDKPGGSCKYKYSSWGTCDPVTQHKTRTGTLKKASPDSKCEEIITNTKPCRAKPKKTRGKKQKGKKTE